MEDTGFDVAEVGREVCELAEAFRRSVEQVGRRLVEQRLHRSDDHRDVVVETVIGVGITFGVTPDFVMFSSRSGPMTNESPFSIGQNVDGIRIGMSHGARGRALG